VKAIVEKKTWKSHNYSRYVAQAVAAYLIAREKVSGIRSAIVEVEGRARRVELSSDLVGDVEKVAELLEGVLESEKPPGPRAQRSARATSTGSSAPTPRTAPLARGRAIRPRTTQCAGAGSKVRTQLNCS